MLVQLARFQAIVHHRCEGGILPRFGLLLLGLLIGACTLSRASAGDAAFATTTAALAKLSQAERHALIVAAFEHRLRHGANILYVSQTRLANHKFDGHSLGDLLEKLNGEDEDVKRLGLSYRIDARRGGTDVSIVMQTVSNHFDAKVGVNRGMFRADGRRPSARIDTDQDISTHLHLYQYWFDGKHTNMAEYIFRYLLDHKSEYSSTINTTGQVVLTVPWKPRWSQKPLGFKEYTLDPAKGFMPVAARCKWEDKEEDGMGWRTEDFVVQDATLVGDVWMPLKLRETVAGSTLPGVANVYDTTVTRVVHGAVSEKDLKLEFPVGTEVVDVIKGNTYIIEPNGQISHESRLYSPAEMEKIERCPVPPQAKPDSSVAPESQSDSVVPTSSDEIQASGNWRIWAAVVGTTAFAIAMLFWLARRK